ncbi:MAG: trigger factor [Lachnospiraceae bacterium]|nr:trigger factor [Lachnospiraceae bacterium]
MKKRVSIVLTTAVCALLLVSCGETAKKDGDQNQTAEENSENTNAAATDISTKDYKVEDYVTLGDYEGMEVEVQTYNYTDEDVEKELQGEVDYYVQTAGAYDYQPLEKDTVEEGDTVNIDYKGLKDGVAFDGGTAEGSHLTIGSGQFIDGFESGLVGHKVGEEVSLNLTFPEQYHSAELAGQAVVFEVKINAIEEQKKPELTDELVQQMGLNLNSVDELRQTVRDYLDTQCKDRFDSEKKAAVWEAVFNKCTIKEPPQEMVDDVKARMLANLSNYAQQYQVSEEEFVQQYMETTMEDYQKEMEQSALVSAQGKLAAAAIANQAGISVSDEELDKYASDDAAKYNYENKDAVLNEMGRGAYYDYVLGQKVDDYLLTKIKIKEKEPISIYTDADEKTLAQ